jgi:hypothetical protein
VPVDAEQGFIRFAVLREEAGLFGLAGNSDA